MGDSEGLALGDADSDGVVLGEASALGDAGLAVGDAVEEVVAVVVGDEDVEVVALGCWHDANAKAIDTGTNNRSAKLCSILGIAISNK